MVELAAGGVAAGAADLAAEIAADVAGERLDFEAPRRARRQEELDVATVARGVQPGAVVEGTAEFDRSGDRLEVCRARNVTKLVVSEEWDFFRIMRRKLRWGGPGWDETASESE